MSTTSILLGVLGVALSFMAPEISASVNFVNGAIALQMLGATYFAFAMVNWMAKGTLIGGIYGRPIATGNFTHFAIGALALIKHVMNTDASSYLLVLAAAYSVFALVFGLMLFTSPKLNTDSAAARS